MNKIKFIYFDVGGVLVFDFTHTHKWAEMKKDLGVTATTDGAFESVWQKYKNRICVGCDVDTLIPEFRAIGVLPADGYSMLKDFVARFDQNQFIWPILKLASKKYKIGLLTNMYPRMLKLIMKKNLIHETNYNVIVDSSVVGFQKPEVEIFKIAEEKSGVKPAEILFIENLSSNTKAAQKRGWQVFLYDDQHPKKASQELLDILELG